MKHTRAILITCLVLFSCSTPSLIKLTPDIISGYGLNEHVIKQAQCYFKSINIHADGSVGNNEPTMFHRIDSTPRPVTDDSSEAKRSDSIPAEYLFLKDTTKCLITEVLENGKVLRADFDNDFEADFRLSYRTGYAFELISDTVSYRGLKYVRTQTPLIENIGILYIDGKRLRYEKTTVPGKALPEKE
ncbi:MAG: hypothetical protein JW913_20680 [Chitinispirillaceae bacterium]|nr:hypothetical protein [Chitinispirillaceae bacterium]